MQNFAWRPLRQSCTGLPRSFGRIHTRPSVFARPKSTAATTGAKELNWVEYLEIRRRRRQWQTGIDPMMFYGGCTFLCMGTALHVGSTLWRFMNRNLVAKIDARDREFYKHVARTDATNPVPDYYGEKICSLRQYRQWLRDQAKYRRKALLPEE
ncbi:mitochondrial import protein Pam17-domain-containing protein [Mycena sp. CBHHK59/15]|nr:mitochondrial import protein Pam17-domain-containing protein [Mycena sp. CBHHK59/15]